MCLSTMRLDEPSLAKGHHSSTIGAEKFFKSGQGLCYVKKHIKHINRCNSCLKNLFNLSLSLIHSICVCTLGSFGTGKAWERKQWILIWFLRTIQPPQRRSFSDRCSGPVFLLCAMEGVLGWAYCICSQNLSENPSIVKCYSPGSDEAKAHSSRKTKGFVS